MNHDTHLPFESDAPRNPIPDRSAELESITPEGRYRVESQPVLQPLGKVNGRDHVAVAIGEFAASDIVDELTIKHLAKICSTLRRYNFEWYSTPSGRYCVRSAEMLGASGDGVTIAAALRTSIHSHAASLSRLIESEDDIPEPRHHANPNKTKQLSVRITEHDYRKLKEEADIRSTSVSGLFREIVNATIS